MTPALKKRYLGLLAEGVTRTRAATAINMTNAGIAKAMRDDKRFEEDVQQVLAVRNDDVEHALYLTALKGNVEAQKFWLTNRSSDEWANRSRVEHTGRDGGPIAIATQATVALRNVLMSPDTREAAIDFVDAELVVDDPRELASGSEG